MQSTQKKPNALDSRLVALESRKNSNLAQDIFSHVPSIIGGAFSQRNVRHLSFLLPSWRLVKLLLSMIALYLLIQADAKAQYQDYPISPPKPAFSTAPKYSIQDSIVIADYGHNIVSHIPIQKGPGNKVICDLFLTGSRIVAISKVGSYWRVKAQFRSYTDLYFFKASKYNLSWIRAGMLTDKSESNKQYVQMIHENKARIAARNQAIKDSIANENRSFISKIINPQ